MKIQMGLSCTLLSPVTLIIVVHVVVVVFFFVGLVIEVGIIMDLGDRLMHGDDDLASAGIGNIEDDGVHPVPILPLVNVEESLSATVPVGHGRHRVNVGQEGLVFARLQPQRHARVVQDSAVRRNTELKPGIEMKNLPGVSVGAPPLVEGELGIRSSLLKDPHGQLGGGPFPRLKVGQNPR